MNQNTKKMAHLSETDLIIESGTSKELFNHFR